MLTENESKVYIRYEALPSPLTWEYIQKEGYEKIASIITSWKEVAKENSVIWRYNNALYAEAIGKTVIFFTDCGVKFYKRSATGKVTGMYKEAKLFADALKGRYRVTQPSCPYIFKITYKGEVVNTGSGDTLTMLETAKRMIENIDKQAVAKSESFKKSLKVAAENNIDISGCGSPQEIYNLVNETMQERWISENYPDGTSVYLKHTCDSCNEWIVGDHRCSCGNRRMYLLVEGDFISGFYAYPEAN
jgi:hypothetical protein